MTKQQLKEISKEYEINHKVLKDVIKESNKNYKELTRREVVEIIYINCTDLFYCRKDEFDFIEYSNQELIFKLANELGE